MSASTFLLDALTDPVSQLDAVKAQRVADAGAAIAAQQAAAQTAIAADRAGALTAIAGLIDGKVTSALVSVDTLVAGAKVQMSVAPKQATPGPILSIGQAAADAGTSSDSGKYVTLPAAAIARPADAGDWYVAIHCRTGQIVGSSTTGEALAANGTSFTSGAASNRVLGLSTRTATGAFGAWRWLLSINATNRDLFTGFAAWIAAQPLVQFGDWCLVFGIQGGRPYFAAQQIGGARQLYQFAGTAIASFDSFYFPAAAVTDGSVSRTSGVLTFNKTGLSSTIQPGVVLLIQSTDQPSINGVYTVATRVAGNTGFTVASTGADFAVTAGNASYAIIRTASDLLTTLGGLSALLGASRYSWSGGIQRVECRWGTLPITAGQIDLAWLNRLANRQLTDAQLPGVKRFAATANGAAGMTVDADGTINAAVAVTGAVGASPAIGTDWLVVDSWDGHTPFASDYDPTTRTCTTGTIGIGYTSFEPIGALLGYVVDANGATVAAERMVSPGPGKDGRGTITLAGVPNGTDLYLRLRPSQGAAYTMTWGPFCVGPSIGFVNQSTDNVLFGLNTGAALAPVATAIGIGTAGDVAGYLGNVGTNPTDQKGFCRLARKRMAQAGQAGDGIVAFTNTLLTLLNAASGRPMAAAAYALLRSGHPADAYWADRVTFTNAIGIATGGAALAGTWAPHPMWTASVITFTEKGTVQVWRGGAFAQKDPADPTSPYQLTGGTLVGLVQADGTIAGSVAGTFNHDTGAFSITDPVGGALYVTGRMQLDTLPASTAGGRQAVDGFTVWGSDTEADSGHISNLLKAMPRQTAFHWSWTNYLLSYAATHTQAEVNAKVAFDIDMVKKRIEANYPVQAGLPWIVGSDMRTTSTSSIGEHKIRLALRAYAKARTNVFYSIGAITCDMDGLNSPHPGTLASSGQLAGATYAHGVARALGIAGAKAEEVYIVAAQRSADGASVDLTFNTPASANLTCSDPTKMEGLFFGTADDAGAMALVDVKGGTYSTAIMAANKVRVTKASGAFPATTYWNTHVGFVLQEARATGETTDAPALARETTRLARTLSLDTGGYGGIRPGQPISFGPINILAGQAL